MEESTMEAGMVTNSMGKDYIPLLMVENEEVFGRKVKESNGLISRILNI
jgi:hypothetical protein